MDSFSVIVPVHNNAAVIGRTLQSLEDAVEYFQGRERARGVRAEIIIVDDGSSDATPTVVNDFIQDKKAYRLLRRRTSSSASCARNTGVSQAQGDVLFFLDGDDLYRPNHIDECFRLLEDPARSFVKTGVSLADPVHADWKPRIETSLVINLCLRRRCHDFFGGFPDYHIFRRQGDLFSGEMDIFRQLEDHFYNQMLLQLYAGVQLSTETVEYCRHPGNSYDRQYNKFCQPYGSCPESNEGDRFLRYQLGNLLIQHHLGKLRATHSPQGSGS